MTEAPLPPPPTMPPGWYPDQQPGMVRWWDGQQWTQNVQPAPPAAAAPAFQAGPQHVIQTPYTMTTTAPKKTSHGLHLFLTIITAGVWGVFVWIPITIIHKFTKDKSVTRVGY